MKRESNVILKSLFFSAKKYDSKKEISNKQKMENVLETLLKELLKKGIPLKVVSSITKDILDSLEISNGVLSKPDTTYAWQKQEINKKIHVLLSPQFDNLKGNENVFLAIALANDGIVELPKNFDMFEVLVFNKELEDFVSLQKPIIENIDFLRKNYLENPRFACVINAFNPPKADTLGMDVYIENHYDSISPIIDVLLRKVDIFHGIVNSEIATWIAMTCIAAGVKAEFRQVFLEDAISKKQTIESSPTIERTLSRHSRINNYHTKTLRESDICKSVNVQSFVIPLKRNDGVLEKYNKKNLVYLRCYDKQVFRIKK